MTTGGSASAATRNEFVGAAVRRSPTATATAEASTIMTAVAGQLFTLTTFDAVAELLKRTCC